MYYISENLICKVKLEAADGFEPSNKGFAVLDTVSAQYFLLATFCIIPTVHGVVKRKIKVFLSPIYTCFEIKWHFPGT